MSSGSTLIESTCSRDGNAVAAEDAARSVAVGSKRVLIISYPFPPVGGAGVQRATKFVKYLPEHGWTPAVLTVANPSVPALDQSLLADVPPDIVVRRARTLEPGYGAKAAVSSSPSGQARGARTGLKSAAKGLARSLARICLQPDPQILWMPGALREGRRLLKEMPCAAIFASGPPFSTFMIAARLSKQFGLPLILDYRDEWDISNTYLENKRLNPFSLRLQSWMQSRVVRTAKVLVATTAHSARALDSIRQRSGGTASVDWIYNGFDPHDFAWVREASHSKNEIYRLVYVGTLWNLTDIEPLVRGIELLAAKNAPLAGKLELVVAGRRTSEQSQVLGRLRGLPCRLVEHPYLDHHGALELIRSADGLCVLLSDVPSAERVVPAKIFEYLAAKRPIIAIGPRGEMWDILQNAPFAKLNTPGDIPGIVQTLADEINRLMAGRPVDFADFDPSPYDRRSQAGQLARILDRLTGVPATAG